MFLSEARYQFMYVYSLVSYFLVRTLLSSFHFPSKGKENTYFKKRSVRNRGAGNCDNLEILKFSGRVQHARIELLHVTRTTDHRFGKPSV